MDDKRLGNVEAMFADIIWKNEPLSSGELAKICADELKWKKSSKMFRNSNTFYI